MSTDNTLTRVVVLVLAIVLLFPVLMMVLMLPMGGMWGGDHMWNGHMWGNGGGWAWLVMWLVALAVFFGIGYLLYRAVGGSPDRRTDPAMEELRMAYARGDLTDEEFEKRRERLRREE